jgi:hypothetical protein
MEVRGSLRRNWDANSLERTRENEPHHLEFYKIRTNSIRYSMDWKNIALLLIGVIIGGGIGYSVSLVYTPQFIEGILPDNYKTQLDELIQQHRTLAGQYENTTADMEALQEQFDQLSQEHQALTDDYASMSEELEDLTERHDALFTAYNESVESYDSLLMQYEIITGSPPLTPQPVSNDTIRKDYAWSHSGETWTLTLYVPVHLHDYYRNKTRIPTEDYSVYVTHPLDDEYVSTIVEKINEVALQEGYDEIQVVNLVIAFVQSLPYTPDSVSTSFDEYPRYPLETLVYGGGDCEDTSILTSALLGSLDYGVVLINLPEHLAVGVDVDAFGSYFLHEDKRYFFLETTGEGWEIGEMPDEYEGESAIISPIVPIPICTHEWTASILRHKLTLVADIQNVGTAEAKGIKLYAAFMGKGEQIWNPEESAFFNLNIEEETSIMLELSVPRDVRTRLVVRVLDPWGDVMDESYSEWFDTD